MLITIVEGRFRKFEITTCFWVWDWKPSQGLEYPIPIQKPRDQLDFYNHSEFFIFHVHLTGRPIQFLGHTGIQWDILNVKEIVQLECKGKNTYLGMTHCETKPEGNYM